jgi:hypothetical protein
MLVKVVYVITTKKFHNNNDNLLTTNNNFLTTNHNFLTNNNIKKYNCRYCNKEYNIQQSKSKHEQKCKINNNDLIMINKQKEIEIIKLEQLKNEAIIKH